ncbi:LexA family protein [Streptomyces chartreusis]|uniref:LexA family protein n=1 Tax=Streptomyces chartreusis TaxID=1969 RepID=UPI00386CAFB6
MVHAPIVGRLAAGVPITTDEHVEDVLALPRQLVGSGQPFALTVSGDSIIQTHIMHSDSVAVRAQRTPRTARASLLAGSTVVQRNPVRIGAVQQQCGGRHDVQQVWRHHPVKTLTATGA